MQLLDMNNDDDDENHDDDDANYDDDDDNEERAPDIDVCLAVYDSVQIFCINVDGGEEVYSDDSTQCYVIQSITAFEFSL